MIASVEEFHTPGSFLALMTERQVAATCGVSVASVRRWRRLGMGPKSLKVGGCRRYKQEDVRDWIDSRPTHGGSYSTRLSPAGSEGHAA